MPTDAASMRQLVAKQLPAHESIRLARRWAQPWLLLPVTRAGLRVCNVSWQRFQEAASNFLSSGSGTARLGKTLAGGHAHV